MRAAIALAVLCLSLGCVPDPAADRGDPAAAEASVSLSESNAVDSDSGPAPACEGLPVVTSDSLGPIAIGATVRQVLSRCPRVRRVEVFDEGDPYPALEVTVDGVGLLIMIEGDSLDATVYRVTSSDPAARTVHGLGPGALLSDVAARYGPLEFGDNECALYAWGPRLPGVSWGVDYPNEWDCSAVGSVGRSGGATLPASTRVTLLFVRERN
jgi:hypothetical protein